MTNAISFSCGRCGLSGTHLVEQAADRADDVDVLALAVAADVVGLARLARAQDQRQRLGMVLDMQPVAHVLALAVDRQALAAQAR